MADLYAVVPMFKTKRKKKARPGFRLILTCSPEQCLERLEKMCDGYTSFLERYRFEKQHVDEDVWQFSLSRSLYSFPAYRLVYMHQRGQQFRANYIKTRITGVIHQDGQTGETIVSGWVKTPQKTYIVNAVWFVLFAPTVLIMTLDGVLNAEVVRIVFGVVLGLALYYLTIAQPKALAKEHRKELADEIAFVLKGAESNDYHLPNYLIENKKGVTRKSRPNKLVS